MKVSTNDRISTFRMGGCCNWENRRTKRHRSNQGAYPGRNHQESRNRQRMEVPGLVSGIRSNPANPGAESSILRSGAPGQQREAKNKTYFANVTWPVRGLGRGHGALSQDLLYRPDGRFEFLVFGVEVGGETHARLGAPVHEDVALEQFAADLI